MQQNETNLAALMARIKREAKKLKRAQGISHTTALEQLSRSSGFSSWHDLVRRASRVPHRLATKSRALSSELIIAFDDEELSGVSPSFSFVVDATLAKELEPRWLADTQPWRKASWPAPDLWWLRRLTFLRFTGSVIPMDIDQAAAMVMRDSRWAPWFVWLRGEFFDLRDEKGTSRINSFGAAAASTQPLLEENEDILENPVVVRMLEWFRERYKDPAEGVPHDSGEGGYQYVNGGPYDPSDELGAEFDLAPWRYIQAAAQELYSEVGPDWVKVDEY